MTPCASETAFRACDDCADIDSCRLRYVMRRARDAAANVLETHSLGDILASTESELPRRLAPHLVPPLGL
jgi:DNA-binding IscR family transcriptional regulator